MKKIIIFLSFLVFSIPCFAAPAITSFSGSLSHNGAVTITGTSFGAKTTATPIHFDTFESSTVGESVGDSFTHWEERSTEENPLTISNQNQRHTLSTKNLLSDMATGYKGAWVNNIGFADTGKAYINFWVRIDFGTGSADYYQLKMFRITVGVESNGDALLPTLLLTHWTQADFPTTGGYVNSYHQLYNSYPSHNIYWPHDTFNQPADLYTQGERVWVNLAVQLDEGDYDTANAKFTGWVTKPSISVIEKKEDFNFLFRDTTDHVDAIGLHNYLGAGSNYDAVVYYDDFYIDNSWARVEIGDNSNYDSCTHREIQIPTAWAAGEITVTLNQGSLNQIGGKYLFVVDADGVASAGFLLPGAAVTLGGTKEITFSGTKTIEFQ